MTAPRFAVRNPSLRFMLSASFTAASIILMLTLFVLMISRFNSSTEQSLKESSQRLLSQVHTNVNSLLRTTMASSDNLYYEVLKNYEMDEPDLAESFKLVYDTSEDSLVGAGVFDMSGNLLLTQPYSRVNPNSSPTEQSWFRDASSVIENIHFSLPHVQDTYSDPTGTYHWVISVSRSVELTRNGRVFPGILLLDMDFSDVSQMLRTADTGSGGYLFITDQNGDLIYHPRQQLINSGLDEEENLHYANLEDDVYSDTASNRIVAVQTVGYTGWKLVLSTPSQSAIAGAPELQAFTMLFILLIIALIILVNFLISSRIARPIKDLEEQVTDYEKGERHAFTGKRSGSPEISHLRQAIQSLVNKEEALRQDIVIEQDAKRRSELEALQAQIHPHFLYNTLDAIVWMIENKRYDGAVEMVTSLARFFRLSLAKGKSITTIANELDHVRHYLNIQKVRFRDQFTYSIEVEPEIALCKTIKLIVQPLVENAVYHGTSKLDGEGHITVKAYQAEDSIYIDVEDNGLGMSEEVQNQIINRSLVTHSTHSGSGIGIANVDERVRLFFGPTYGLSIISEPDEGTLIRIHLPRVDELRKEDQEL